MKNPLYRMSFARFCTDARTYVSTILVVFVLSTPIMGSPFKVSGLEALMPIAVAPVPKENLQVLNIPLTYLSAETASSHLKGLFDSIKITHSDDRHALVILATPSDIDHIKTVIALLDQPVKQVKFDVQIIEVKKDFTKQYDGLLLDATNGFQLNYDFDQKALRPLSGLTGIISALIQSGDAKILANPQVTILDSKTAQVRVGDRIPYTNTVFHNDAASVQVHFIDTGILLTISAEISSKNRVTAEIHSEVSGVTSWKQFEGVEFPVISSRATDSTVQLQDQETLIIAGLLHETNYEVVSKFPLLGDLPFIGGAFRSKKMVRVQTDVLFMITPHILGSVGEVAP